MFTKKLQSNQVKFEFIQFHFHSNPLMLTTAYNTTINLSNPITIHNSQFTKHLKLHLHHQIQLISNQSDREKIVPGEPARNPRFCPERDGGGGIGRGGPGKSFPNPPGGPPSSPPMGQNPPGGPPPGGG